MYYYRKKSKKVIVLFLILVIIVIGAIYWYFKNFYKTLELEPEQATEQEELIIRCIQEKKSLLK